MDDQTKIQEIHEVKMFRKNDPLVRLAIESIKADKDTISYWKDERYIPRYWYITSGTKNICVIYNHVGDCYAFRYKKDTIKYEFDSLIYYWDKKDVLKQHELIKWLRENP